MPEPQAEMVGNKKRTNCKQKDRPMTLNLNCASTPRGKVVLSEGGPELIISTESHCIGTPVCVGGY